MDSSLLSILPNETIYSWCATNHAMSCSSRSSATALMLLNTSHAVRQHEFPHSITNFLAISNRGPESVLEVLREHTIAGFYLPFIHKHAQQELAAKALDHQSTHWMRVFQGSSRTQRVLHPLKWCARCILDDTEKIGRPFWHTAHQYPTALMCYLHQLPLNWTNRRSKHWRLPEIKADENPALPVSLGESAYTAAALSANLKNIPLIDMFSLRRFALHRLQEIGVIHSTNGARHERVIRWFTSTKSCALAQIAQPSLIPLINGNAIPGLLWRQKRNTAVTWVILWSAFEWESTNEAINSFTAAASGMALSHRGQLQLFDEVESCAKYAPEHVHEAFQCCDSYADVMKHLGASRADIIRWLDNDPHLRNSWRARLREGRLTECIERIRSVLRTNLNTTRSDLNKCCSAEFSWLRIYYPHQLSKLIATIPNKSSKQSQFEY